jgi:hypothetical protein
MAIIAMFYGIIVSMYYLDNRRHNLPHIHVKYQDQEAVLSIPDGNLLAASHDNEFSPKDDENSLPQRHEDTKTHQGVLFFFNLVPWCLGGYFHGSRIISIFGE